MTKFTRRHKSKSKKFRRERDVVFAEPTPSPPSQTSIISASQNESVKSQSRVPAVEMVDKAVQVLLPFQPAVFSIQSENELVRLAGTLSGKWTVDPFGKSTAEQDRLRQEYVKAWRGAGALHYTRNGSVFYTPATERLLACKFRNSPRILFSIPPPKIYDPTSCLEHSHCKLAGPKCGRSSPCKHPPLEGVRPMRPFCIPVLLRVRDPNPCHSVTPWLKELNISTTCAKKRACFAASERMFIMGCCFALQRIEVWPLDSP